MELAGSRGATPLVSVHCITFNHAPYIKHALDSFLAQKTTFPIEVVVGEDCSSDGTREIVEAYINRHPSVIRLITSDRNVGAVANYERTLKACKGKYVAICEGDDYWRDPYKLQSQVDFLERNPEYVLAFHDAIGFDCGGFDPLPNLPTELQIDADSLSLIRTRPISTLTVCFRNVIRELPQEIRSSPILDLCMWSLLGWHGKGKYMPQIAPAAYRRHPGGLMSMQSNQARLRMTAQAYLCLSRYYDRIQEEDISEYFLREACTYAGFALPARGKLRAVVSIMKNLLYCVKRGYRT
jgi:glycosyltransferase involved in cell wall biosynthesis